VRTLVPARRRVALLAAAVVASLICQSVPAGAEPPRPAPTAAETVHARPGAGPVAHRLPAGATSGKALPAGKRPPPVPPAVAAAGRPRHLADPHKLQPAAPATRALGAADAPASGAGNLALRPGFAIGDTSVVLYFDVADPGLSAWTSWQATLYDATNGTAQASVTLPPSEATPCASLRQFCRTFTAGDGWVLVAGQQYFATITVTLSDGTTVTSPASDQAKARNTIVPPALADAQATGCACGDVLYAPGPAQAVRGAGVNTGLGTFIWSDIDLQLNSLGVAFTAGRIYSSGNTAAGSLGVGWSWTLDVRVIPPAGDATAVTVVAEDGARAVFTRNDDGSYARPPGVRTNLSIPDGGGWRLVTPDQVTYLFDAGGRLTSVKNTRGQGLTIAYGTTAWTVTDAAGHVVKVSVDASGRVTKVALPDGRSVRYGYSDGKLATVTDVMANTWRYTYAGQLLQKIVDPRGNTVVTNVYGADGRVSSQADADGAVTRFGWDGIQQATTIDPDGVTWVDGYRGHVLLFSQNGTGDTTNRRYDAALNPNLLVDANGNQRESGFDGSGNVTSALAPHPFLFTETSSYDAHNNPTAMTDALGGTATYTYTAFDEIANVTDALGNQSVARRDDRGLVTAVTDPRGKTTTMEYDKAGNMVAQTTPLGEKSTFAYDSAGRLICSTDPLGNTTRFTYDDADRLVKVQEPDKARPTETVYDTAGEVAKTIDTLGRDTSYRYDKVINRLLSTTDPNGGTTSTTYTPGGREASVTDAEGNKTTNTYDARGNLATVVSPRGTQPGANAAGFTTTYVYDRNGNLLRTEHPYPGGGTVTLDTGFDELDRPATSIDAFGKVTTTGYDNVGDVTSIVDPLGQSLNLQYDQTGRPTARTYPLGGSAKAEYDKAGNVVKVTGASGGITTWTYDDDGRVATVTEPRGNVPGANPADFTTHYAYDANGNLVSATDQAGHKRTYAYDSNARMVGTTDAGKHSIRYRYDDFDQLTAVTGPDDGDTRYTYDNLGHVKERTDANGHATNSAYDRIGRLVSSIDPLGHRTDLHYDAQSNLTSIVLPGSGAAAARTITGTYDILDRLTGRQLGSGGPAYAYGYDAKNRMTGLTDPAGTRTQAFDDLDRLTAAGRGPGQEFTYSYDRDSNVSGRTLPDGTHVASVFDAADQLTSMTVSDGAAGAGPATYGFGYDAAGHLTRTTYPGPGNLVTDRTYDNAGILSELASRNDTGDVARFQVARDPVGNPTGVTTTRGSRSQAVAYTYDAADRLLAACYGASSCGSGAANAIRYEYDRVGNRQKQVLSGSAGNSTTAYTYDAADRLTKTKVKAGGKETEQSLTYDPMGNLTGSGAASFTYNLDHTTASATVAGSTTRYGYDATGLRISATGGSGTRTWGWDVNGAEPQLATETLPAGTTRDFVPGGPEPTDLGLVSGGVTVLLPDLQDGVAAAVGPDGATAAEYDYDPFGNPRGNGTATATSTVDNPLRFASQYQDATLGDRYAFQARDYDPATGRFDSVDPVPPGTRVPSVSPYAYVGDQPTVLGDPTGASSNKLHDAAEAAALTQLYARYHMFNVYGGDVAPTLRGVPGQICVTTVRLTPREPLKSCPDIIVRDFSRTLVYEVKPASRYGRSGRTAAQVNRYVRSLRPPRFPGAQAGPPIRPATRPAPGGGILIIFSAAQWSSYAPSGLRAPANGSGVIYYVKRQQPKRKPKPKPKPATAPAPAPAPVPEPDLGPDVGLIPNLGDFLNPEPAPAPAPAPAPDNPAPACIPVMAQSCPPGYIPNPNAGPGVVPVVPFPELPGLPGLPGLPVFPEPVPIF